MAIDFSLIATQLLQFSLQGTLAATAFCGGWIVLVEASRDW